MENPDPIKYLDVREVDGKFYVYEVAFGKNVSRAFDDELMARHFMARMLSAGIKVLGV